MEGELTNLCHQYYDLMLLTDQQVTHFNALVEKALPYTGQTNAKELDAIIRCNRRIQKALAEAESSTAAMKKIGRTIIKIMEYFEIEPYTSITCELPGEIELDVWADEEKNVHCYKTKDLDPVIGNPNIITIRLVTSPYRINDDDDWFDS
jgi:hypothetical protein